MRYKKWVCLHCNKVMDKSNFVDFIKESDNEKNSTQESKSSISLLETFTIIIIRGRNRSSTM